MRHSIRHGDEGGLCWPTPSHPGSSPADPAKEIPHSRSAVSREALAGGVEPVELRPRRAVVVRRRTRDVVLRLGIRCRQHARGDGAHAEHDGRLREVRTERRALALRVPVHEGVVDVVEAVLAREAPPRGEPLRCAGLGVRLGFVVVVVAYGGAFAPCGGGDVARQASFDRHLDDLVDGETLEAEFLLQRRPFLQRVGRDAAWNWVEWDVQAGMPLADSLRCDAHVALGLRVVSIKVGNLRVGGGEVA